MLPNNGSIVIDLPIRPFVTSRSLASSDAKALFLDTVSKQEQLNSRRISVCLYVELSHESRALLSDLDLNNMLKSIIEMSSGSVYSGDTTRIVRIEAEKLLSHTDRVYVVFEDLEYGKEKY